MLRRKELLWFYQEGASFIFPDEWERYIAPIPLVERWYMISAYNRLLTDDSSEDRKAEMLMAAKAWSSEYYEHSRVALCAMLLLLYCANNSTLAREFVRSLKCSASDSS